MKLTVIIWGASYLHFDLSLRQNARMRYRTHDTHTSRIYSAVFNLSAVGKNYKQIVPLASKDDNFTFSPWWWVYPGDKYQKHTYQFANTLPPGKAHTPRRETVYMGFLLCWKGRVGSRLYESHLLIPSDRLPEGASSRNQGLICSALYFVK